MTDFEKEKDTVELPLEDLEQAAGGTGSGKRLFRVTKDCAVRSGPGKDHGVLHVLHVGDMLRGFLPFLPTARILQI